ncbi:PIN domain-containing protein [Catellatospora sp. KI3]|uniref:PIN domain-containing protein n=1 Tax=Catellatospora sp. KI3 TaxID=3041620 RepID=UPI00248258FD|nr:PIN domain-containing protein [Catellatospora sp. KI3]MDI1464964.1 PIN domain-containing protein [Catellatospora sp. KI3]
MAAAVRYPFPIYLVDTSVWARRTQPTVSAALAELTRSGELGTCALLTAEVCYSARNSEEYGQLRALLDATIMLNGDDLIEEKALAAQAKLAAEGQHRTSVVGLFVAAVAAAHDAVVLHYDSDYERICAALGTRAQWVVPRGSVA